MSKSFVPIQTPGRAGDVDLVAGVLCLDFVNTLDPRVVTDDGTIPRNYLTGYNEFVAWAQHVEIVKASQGQGLLREAQQQPEQAQEVLKQALALRETIYHIFFAITQNQEVPSADLETLKHLYSQAITQAQLTPTGEHFDFVWRDDSTALMAPLWPVVASAIELLRHGERARIKDCSTYGEGCGWLFYDTSKNNSRRWCSMRTCGMQSKDRRRGKRDRRSAKDE